MFSVTTEAAANVSFQSAQPSSQRSGRSSEAAFETLVDASAQGSHAKGTQSPNSRDPFNGRPNVPRQDHVAPEQTGDSQTSSARPPQAAAGSDIGIRKLSVGAEASNGAHHHRTKHEETEVASTEDGSGPMLVASEVDQTTPQPVTTPPAVAVPVTTPPAAAMLSATTAPTAAPDSATASTGAAGVLPAQATATACVTPANTGFNPIAAADTAAATATILQQAMVPTDTQQAAQTTAMQTGGTLAAAVVQTAPSVSKATVKTLDNASSGRTTASVITGIQPGPEASVSTTPSAAGGNPVSSPDAALADHKHDAATATDGAKTASSDTGTPKTQPGAATPQHLAQAADAAAAPQPGPTDSGQSINSALAQPQVQSAAATIPAAPQYNVAVVAGAAVPLNGLAVQIAVTALSGKSRFEIRLDPADLGRIDVRLDVDRQGRVTSHLTVEKPETLAMLRQDAPQLQRALQDAGLKTGDGGLQFSLRDQSSQQQNARDGTGGHHNQRLIVTEENIPVAAAGRDYGRILGSNGGLDIRV